MALGAAQGNLILSIRSGQLPQERESFVFGSQRPEVDESAPEFRMLERDYFPESPERGLAHRDRSSIGSQCVDCASDQPESRGFRGRGLGQGLHEVKSAAAARLLSGEQRRGGDFLLSQIQTPQMNHAAQTLGPLSDQLEEILRFGWSVAGEGEDTILAAFLQESGQIFTQAATIGKDQPGAVLFVRHLGEWLGLPLDFIQPIVQTLLRNSQQGLTRSLL